MDDTERSELTLQCIRDVRASVSGSVSSVSGAEATRGYFETNTSNGIPSAFPATVRLTPLSNALRTDYLDSCLPRFSSLVEDADLGEQFARIFQRRGAYGAALTSLVPTLISVELRLGRYNTAEPREGLLELARLYFLKGQLHCFENHERLILIKLINFVLFLLQGLFYCPHLIRKIR